MADRYARDVALNLNTPPCDQQPVEGEPSILLAFHPQIVRQRRLPLHEPDDGTLSVSSADLQGLLGLQRDADRLDVYTTVRNLDDGIFRLVRLPLVQGLVDASECLYLADKIERVVGRLGKRTVVFPAADIGAESVMIGDPNALLRRLEWREGDAAELGVHSDLAGQRPVSPVSEVGRDDLVHRDGLAQRVLPDFERLSIPVVERNANGRGLGSLACFGVRKFAA